MTDQKNVLGWQDLGLVRFRLRGKINFTELDFLEVWRTVVDSDRIYFKRLSGSKQLA